MRIRFKANRPRKDYQGPMFVYQLTEVVRGRGLQSTKYI
jgi:hypothetical protein